MWFINVLRILKYFSLIIINNKKMPRRSAPRSTASPSRSTATAARPAP